MFSKKDVGKFMADNQDVTETLLDESIVYGNMIDMSTPTLGLYDYNDSESFAAIVQGVWEQNFKLQYNECNWIVKALKVISSQYHSRQLHIIKRVVLCHGPLVYIILNNTSDTRSQTVDLLLDYNTLKTSLTTWALLPPHDEEEQPQSQTLKNIGYFVSGLALTFLAYYMLAKKSSISE